MSSTSPLSQLLAASGLADKAERIDDNLARLRWGSAMVIVGISGTAIVALAPMFKQVPAGREEAFYRTLLAHNAYMGGMAAFAVQDDGWVVLHAGRPVKGLDGDEFSTLVSAVGRFADQFDDALAAEFFAPAKATGAGGGAGDTTTPAE